ncbi:AAA family ATPase [Streptomyces sp. RFCAC02]|uniref:AAA family ATPase n=1 Tax=Streptomyces sp. RFCAC02 TaxID=2499143 RepID=UPI001F0FA9E1|nr:AAA family ATPase [Streptomyces sp. RFCAC02]
MRDHPRFESLEGLRGTGKSTLAPMLAAARGATLVATVPSFYQPLRHAVDERTNVEARMCLYLSALFSATEEIQHHLDAGNPVVVESYFARCLANHRALGARFDVTVPDWLPTPTIYHLVCADDERQVRLAGRDKPETRWDLLIETVTDQVTDAYASYPMHRIDTTGRDPGEVLRMIMDAEMQGAHPRADTKPVGAHPHLLPPVSRDAAGTHHS